MDPTDDPAAEAAILAVLGDRAEIYPAPLVDEVRRRHPALSAETIRTTLNRLFAERRVARLWHRYLLPEDISDVRTRWLATLERQSGRLDPEVIERARGAIERWDGWRIDHDPNRKHS